ncbi:unnamed protein product [Owenia fusiformis]|uniref:Leucine-rich repeat-containing protein 51 n=1 Tax=Owenia fusiformis TaxID=6347 RepID=A0A8J1THJ1_OWEFU|nr:unnamed protein product [Owenia fusiformis]
MTSPREKTKPGIDCVAKIDTPVDFSFLELTTVSEALDEEPREVSPRKGRPKRTKNDKYDTKCLKLNNNLLQDLGGLTDQVEKLVEDPSEISWIDLSFNELTTIDQALCKYPKLRILYLHGNGISNIREVEKLAKIPTLRKLSLHGNPIENTPGYRNFILTHLTGLQEFDFSAVTKADRATANTWKKMNVMPKHSKKTEEKN